MSEVLKQNPIGVSRLDQATTSRWRFINDWKVEPQFNDRPNMSADVPVEGASPAAQRSTARRKHQEMFKKWSQSRHD